MGEPPAANDRDEGGTNGAAEEATARLAATGFPGFVVVVAVCFLVVGALWAISRDAGGPRHADAGAGAIRLAGDAISDGSPLGVLDGDAGAAPQRCHRFGRRRLHPVGDSPTRPRSACRLDAAPVR
jgi:hypothetical protein